MGVKKCDRKGNVEGGKQEKQEKHNVLKTKQRGGVHKLCIKKLHSKTPIEFEEEEEREGRER